MTNLRQHLADRIPAIEQILGVTGQPGLSIGVIHHGHEIFKYNTGILDIATGQKPNSDSLDCIASLSKAFMAAAIDLLAKQDKLSWDIKVNSIIPDLKHNQEPNIIADLNIHNIYSHHTRLKGLDKITLGLDARILVAKKDLVKACNELPVNHNLRTNFLYNNAIYKLAGNIIERISGLPTQGHFHQEHIFELLGMSHTTAFRAVHETDDNISTR